jgi:hypothetical protein
LAVLIWATELKQEIRQSDAGSHLERLYRTGKSYERMTIFSGIVVEMIRKTSKFTCLSDHPKNKEGLSNP